MFLKNTEKKKKTIEEYIEIAKGDITVHLILTIFFFFLLLYIGYLVDWYYIIIFDAIMPVITIERVTVYFDLKKIKKYLINNNLISKIGKIDFWNEENYFLTDNYMIILREKNIYAIKYSEIKQIYIENYLKLGKNSTWEEYLHVLTKDNEFRILMWTTILVCEEFYDLKKYLLEKNPKIKVLDPIKNIQNNFFTIER